MAGIGISARPITKLERGWRWCKRNRMVAGLALLLFLTLASGTLVASVFAVLHQRAAQDALGLQRQAIDLADKSQYQAYISDMNAATFAWNENNVPFLKELLHRNVPIDDQRDLRGFEWYYFWQHLERCRMTRLVNVPDSAWIINFIGDSGKFVVEHRGTSFAIWDTLNRATMKPAEPHQVGHRSGALLAATMDGRLLAYVPAAGLGIMVLDNTSGTEKALEDDEFQPPYYAASFSHDGSLLVTADDGGNLVIWDTVTARKETRFRSHTVKIISVACSPDGNQVAFGARVHGEKNPTGLGGLQGSVMLWDTRGNKDDGEELLIEECSPMCLQFSPKGTLLAVPRLRDVVIFDMELGKEQILRGHDRDVFSLACSPDGQLLASGGYDRTVRLWRISDLSHVETLKGHVASTWGVAFSPTGDVLASASLDKTVRLWDVSAARSGTGSDVLPMKFPSSGYEVALNADGSTLCTLSAGKSPAEGDTVVCWDTKSGQPRYSSVQPGFRVASLAISSNDVLALGGAEGQLEWWNLHGCTRIQQVSKLNGSVTTLAFARDREMLTYGTSAGEIAIVDLKTLDRTILPRSFSGGAQSVAFSANGELLACIGVTESSVCLWDVLQRSFQRALPCRDVKGGWPGTILFSASGQYIAVADAGVGIYLIDLSRKEDALTVVPCPSASVAFWPNDDRTIISGGHDGAVKIWDLRSLQQKCTMLGHRDTILAVLVAPDGNLVVSASQDHTARLWRAATKAVVGAAGEWWKQ